MARKKSEWQIKEEQEAMEGVVVGTKVTSVFIGRFGDVLSISEAYGKVVAIYKNCHVLVEYKNGTRKMRVRKSYSSSRLNYSMVEDTGHKYSSTLYVLDARDGNKLVESYKERIADIRALADLKDNLSKIVVNIGRASKEQRELATKFVEEYLNLQKKDVQNEQ